MENLQGSGHLTTVDQHRSTVDLRWHCCRSAVGSTVELQSDVLWSYCRSAVISTIETRSYSRSAAIIQSNCCRSSVEYCSYSRRTAVELENCCPSAVGLDFSFRAAMTEVRSREPTVQTGSFLGREEEHFHSRETQKNPSDSSNRD